MVTNLSGNQYPSQVPMPMFPSSNGNVQYTTPWGVGSGTVVGTGTVQIGPLGVSTSVPWAPGFSATPANTVNGLGLASPFATQSRFLHGLNQNSFGQENPYSPLIGTPYDLNTDLIMATGAFGGQQNPSSIYSGISIPFLSDGSMGFGGPGGSQGGNLLDSINFGGLGMGDLGTNGVPLPVPGMQQYPAPQQYPQQYPIPQQYPQQYPIQQPSNPVPGQFDNPTLFGLLPGGNLNGIAQTISTGGSSDVMNRFSIISDGVAKLFMQGQADPNMPRQMWGSGSKLISPFGTFETGVGWAGGNANAGIQGTQASGMAWAKVTAAGMPNMIVNYSNPYYRNYNFNQGFFNT